MSRPVKYLAIVLALVLVAAAVTGIAVWSAQYDPDAPNPGYFVDGKRMENPPVFVSVGEIQVPFPIYRHYFLMYRSYFESYYGAGFYDEDPDGDNTLVLQQSVEQQLQSLYVWLAIAAEEGVALSEEEQQEIQDTLAAQKEEHGEDFATYLNDMYYLDENNYVEVTQMQTLADKAREAYQDKLETQYGQQFGEEADADYDENYISAKHILIQVEQPAGEETAADAADSAVSVVSSEDPAADGEDISAAQQAAQDRAYELYNEIVASEDPAAAFDERMKAYSDDGGLAENPDGYTFTEGEMVDIFYETALGLEEGGISEPVFSDSSNYQGYHIIMRLPLNTDGKAANRESVVAAKINEMITEKESAVIETMPIVRTEAAQNIRALQIQ